MPIRKLPDGTIEADTVAEMLEYEASSPKQASGPKATRLPRTPPPEALLAATRQDRTPPPEDAWTVFCRELAAPEKLRQRKLLALVKGRGEAGITLAELMKSMGEKDPVMVGRTLGAIKKNANKAKVKPEDVIVPRPDQSKDSKYKAGRLLLQKEPPTP